MKEGWSVEEQGKKAEERLTVDPYDVEAWNKLIREAQVSLKTKRIFSDSYMLSFLFDHKYFLIILPTC